MVISAVLASMMLAEQYFSWLIATARSTAAAGMPLPRDPDLLRTSDALMFATLLLPGMLTAGLVAWCCARGGWLPRPLALSGHVVAVLSVAGLLLFPVILWLVWLLAVAVVLLRTTTRTAAE